MNRSKDLQDRIEAATRRWECWVTYASPTKLVVHPDDWRAMGYPEDFEGLPVKPLGIDIEPA